MVAYIRKIFSVFFAREMATFPENKVSRVIM
jgi:hypothetical protein